MKTKNKKNKTQTPQDIYNELKYMIDWYMPSKDASEHTLELLDKLVEKLMDGEGWQG